MMVYYFSRSKVLPFFLELLVVGINIKQTVLLSLLDRTRYLPEKVVGFGDCEALQAHYLLLAEESMKKGTRRYEDFKSWSTASQEAKKLLEF